MYLQHNCLHLTKLKQALSFYELVSSLRKLWNCEVFCSVPILAYPKFGEIFIVDTDGSNTGIGGILSQKIENEDVIAYFSKTL